MPCDQHLAAAGQQLAAMVEKMVRWVQRPCWPWAAKLLREEEVLLAYAASPKGCWTWLYSTNPLERLNEGVKHRTTVTGIFPDAANVERLVGAALMDIDDEWQVDRHYFS